MAKTCIGAESARANTNNVLRFPAPGSRWKYPKPDMDNPDNRRAWESLMDFALFEKGR